MITYENGDYEMFSQPGDEAKQAKQDLTMNFAKNILSYHLFDVFMVILRFHMKGSSPQESLGLKFL